MAPTPTPACLTATAGPFWQILASGLAMALIALVGGLAVALGPARLSRWLEPVIAFAAGALIGGAMFHMLPHALCGADDHAAALGFVALGFAAFLALDLLLEWRHCGQPARASVRPLGPLLLLADGLHNFLGGLAVGAAFLVDVRAGWGAWFAAALHEAPQEIGDFGAIVHAGMRPRRALLWNFVSGLTFPVGGLLVYALGDAVHAPSILALGAGNFLYIAASDLLPEIKRNERLRDAALRFFAFVAGLLALWAAQRAATMGDGQG